MNHTPTAATQDDEALVAEIDRLLGLKPSENTARTEFKIGDLAREFDVTLRTLRFYEDRGLLRPTRRGTSRLYSRRDRMRLRLVQLCKMLGFSLTEAKQLIETYDQPGGKLQQLRTALPRLEEQRAILLSQREDIDRALAAMDASIDLVSHRLSKAGD